MRAVKSPAIEHRVRGADFGLPLIEAVSAIRSHAASRITWHKHARFELLFLLEGATAYEFTGGRAVELPGGHFLVVPPGTVHRGVHDLRMPASLFGIVFDPRARDAGRNAPFSRRDLEWLRGQFERHALAARPMGPELRRLVVSASRQLRAEGPVEGLAGLTLRLQVCAALVEAARQLTGARHGQTERAVAAAVAHMEQHHGEPLAMGDLARAAGCGRARLFQVFKQATGMTPNDYLQRLRVTRSRELLARSDRSVTEIAHAVGFSSAQYFSNVFRKYAGTTPSAFRAAAVRKRR
jgi:AraC-like DNA-binding protein